MATLFREEHQQADIASRRLQIAFWLGALASYLTYSLACALTLFGVGPIIAAVTQDGPHTFSSLYLHISFIAGLIPTAALLIAYTDMQRKMRSTSADEQARALGAELACPEKHRADRLYTNLVAEMSAASGNAVPATYIQRNDDSINAFIVGGADGSLALTVSQGAIDSLTRDELQAIIGHEYGHIENGDPAIYARLTAMVHGYYIISDWPNRQERIHTAPEAQLFDLRGIMRNDDSPDISIPAAAFTILGSILYLYGRLLQAAFSRRREEMADARAVQYTRNPDALVSALKKAWALQENGINPRRPPRDRAHIYFIHYQSGLNRLLRTHPPLAERIRTWGGGDISPEELDAILFDIQEHRRNQYEIDPAKRSQDALALNPTYPILSLDRSLAAVHYPAPVDPAAALLALYIYHSGAYYYTLEDEGIIPRATLDASRNAYTTIEHSEPVAQIALLAHLTQATAALGEEQKNTLEQHIRHLIKHDRQLSRYELAAYIVWRASRIPGGNAADYRAHRDAITYLYTYLASDDPDDDNPAASYQKLLANGLPLTDAPAYDPIDTTAHQNGLRLCRHLETLRQLAPSYRQTLLDSINTYYRHKQQLTLKQAYLRFALQQALAPDRPTRHTHKTRA